MKKLLIAALTWFVFFGLAFAGTPVNLNSANQAQLETVKGIGPVKARAIIEYRTRNGPFKSVDELENVTGFGKVSVGKLRSEITVSSSKPAVSSSKTTGNKAVDPKTTHNKSGL